MKTPKPRRLPSGNYNIQLRIGGESLSITEPTAKECTRRAEYLKAQARALGNVRHREPERITLTEAIDQYIEKRTNILSPSTIRGYRTIQKYRFQPLMDKPVTGEGWQAAINYELADCSPKTVKNAYLFICSVLREQGVEPDKVTLPQIVRAERPFLQPDQIRPFLESIHGQPAEIAALLALHSLRCSELLALDASQISGNRIHVSGAVVPDEFNARVWKPENKNASSDRYIPIMIPRLAELTADIGTGPVVKLSSFRIYTGINSACARAGLPEVGVHGLRHSFASLCYHLGISEAETMRLGGWADPSTMRKIYTHLSDLDHAAASEKLVSFFA